MKCPCCTRPWKPEPVYRLDPKMGRAQKPARCERCALLRCGRKGKPSKACLESRPAPT